MKKKGKLANIFLLGFVAMAGIFGVTASLIQANSTQEIKTANAATDNLQNINFYIEDQCGSINWTYDGGNVHLVFDSISFVSNSGYSSVNDILAESIGGWSGVDDDGKLVVKCTKTNNNVHQYSVGLPWFINSCTVHYYAGSSNRILKKKDGGALVQTTASRNNWYNIFVGTWDGTGWGGDGTFYAAESETTGSGHTIATNYYTVSASAGTGGTVTRTPTKSPDTATANKYYEGQRITLTATPSTGYSFASWSDSGTATHVVRVSSAASYTATFSAHTYTIAFNKNASGATGSTSSVTGVTYNSGGTKSLTSNGFSYDGHRFAGWSTSSSGSVQYTNGQSLTAQNTKDLYPGSSGGTRTLYAIWEEITTYTVTLAVSPSGYGHLELGGSIVTNITVPEGTDYTTDDNVLTFDDVGDVEAVASPLDGYDYEFSYWSSTSGTVNSDITITATFTRSAHTYSVTLNKNSGTTDNLTSYVYGIGATLPTTGTKAGYNFGGWYANSSLIGDRQYSISSSDKGNKSYWAKWTEYQDFWISFDNGATKTQLTKVSAKSGDELYQLSTSSTLTVAGGESITFWRGATAGTATAFTYASNGLTADLSSDNNVITNNNTWKVRNYAAGINVYLKITSSPSGYFFFLGGKEGTISSATHGIESGSTFYVQDLLKKNGAEGNFGSDGCKIAVYFYDPVDDSTSLHAWTTSFCTLLKSEDGVDLYSVTVPTYNGTSMKWGGAIALRFSSSIAIGNVSFDNCMKDNDDSNKKNGVNPGHFADDVQNGIQITYWWGESLPGGYNANGNNFMYTDGGLESGVGIYVDPTSAWGNWDFSGDTSSYHIYGYFFSIVDGDGSADEWSAPATKVPGTSNLWELETPQDNVHGRVEWAKLIIVYAPSAAFTSENKYQTQDLWYSESIKNHTHITFTGSSTGELKSEASHDSSYTDDTRAESWGTRFITNNVLCNGSGSITTDNWATAKSEFKAASEKVEYKIFKATAGSSTNLSKAVERYDYIINKYGTSGPSGHEDFINRLDADSGRIVGAFRNYSPFALFGGEDNFSTIIIIISSSVALLSVTALSILVIRKRKSKEIE